MFVKTQTILLEWNSISLTSDGNLTILAPTAFGSIAPAISLTEKALNHLNKMRIEKSEDLCLRIGVKQGGCSGMSYTMEFEDKANSREDDSVIEYKGFTIGTPFVPTCINITEFQCFSQLIVIYSNHHMALFLSNVFTCSLRS